MQSPLSLPLPLARSRRPSHNHEHKNRYLTYNRATLSYSIASVAGTANFTAPIFAIYLALFHLDMEHIFRMEAATLAAQLVSTTCWGLVADIVDRKRVLQCGFFAQTACITVFFFAQTPGHFMLYAVLLGVGQGSLESAYAPYLAESIGPENSNKTIVIFARMTLCSTIIALILQAISSHLFNIHYRLPPALTVVMGIISTAAALFLPSQFLRRSGENSHSTIPEKFRHSLADFSHNLTLFVSLIIAINVCSMALVSTIEPLRQRVFQSWGKDVNYVSITGTIALALAVIFAHYVTERAQGARTRWVFTIALLVVCSLGFITLAAPSLTIGTLGYLAVVICQVSLPPLISNLGINYVSKDTPAAGMSLIYSVSYIFGIISSLSFSTAAASISIRELAFIIGLVIGVITIIITVLIITHSAARARKKTSD